MAFDFRDPPLSAVSAALHIAGEVWNGRSGKERGGDLKVHLGRISAWMQEVAKMEERDFQPQLLLDLNAMFTALTTNGVVGTIRLRVAPPGNDLPGSYSIETEHGTFVGEAAQLARTIDLLATGLRAQSPTPVPPAPEETYWESPDAEPGELSKSIY